MLNILMIILLIIIVTCIVLVAFFMGANMILNVQAGKKIIESPINTVKVNKRKAEQEELFNKQEKEYQTNLENIENYNGDGTGQINF